SSTIAPGGTGKSSLLLTEAIAMATGKPLLGILCPRRRVAIWNGEDPMDELQRRIAAICKYYRITPEEIKDHLFVQSGRRIGLVLASMQRNGPIRHDDAVSDLIDDLRANHIDCFAADPFVSTHRVPENDNNAIDLVVKSFGYVAEGANCSIELL